MEKKIDELESKRTELCNRMNEVTNEFNKLNKEQRCNRMYAMQRFPALDSLSSEEEKKNRTNEMKIYVEKLQKDILEINLIIEEIEAAIESVNKPDQVIDLEIGGKPFEYHGWDNGGSTGYSWSVETSNESVIKYVRTSGRGKDTSHLSGGGRDFCFQFHAVSSGKATVKIYHSRPWLNNQTPKITLEFRVKECDSDQILKIMRSQFDKFVSVQKEAKRYGVNRDIDWCVGEELFRLRHATYLLEDSVRVKRETELKETSINRELTIAKNQNTNLKLKLEELTKRTEILNRRITWLRSNGEMDWDNVLILNEPRTHVREIYVQGSAGCSKEELKLRGIHLTNKEIEKLVLLREKKVDDLENTLAELLLKVNLVTSSPLPWSLSS